MWSVRSGARGSRVAPSMAKRGAEAVACRAPWETFASHAPSKRARSEPALREPRCGKTACSAGGTKKRKRAEEEEEAEAAPGKRPAALSLGDPHHEQEPTGRTGGLEGRRAARRQEEPGLPPLGDEEADSGEGLPHPWAPKASIAEEHEDDAWHYNSFQYWRYPLPVIDLSDILNLEKEDTTKTRHCSSAGLSEMET